MVNGRGQRGFLYYSTSSLNPKLQFSFEKERQRKCLGTEECWAVARSFATIALTVNILVN